MPGPRAVEIKISKREKGLLEQICRRRRGAQQEVQRAKIVLKASEGMSNVKIAKDLKINRLTVMVWRKRWSEAAESLKAFAQEADDKEVLKVIEDVLSDAYRSGVPPKFSAEQVVQIMALACEEPSVSNKAFSHWTAKELASEASKRKIVASISAQSVERFLKGSLVKATPIALLAKQ